MVALSKAPARASNDRSPPRVLIVSDVRLYREGLAAALAGCQRVEVVGSVAGPDLTVALVGSASARQRAMHAARIEALAAADARLRPGTAMGQVFDAQAEVLDRHGMGAHRLNACGYSLGGSLFPARSSGEDHTGKDQPRCFTVHCQASLFGGR